MREFLLPSLDRAIGAPDIMGLVGELPGALIARKLLEVARIEGASHVAHASLDDSIDIAFAAFDSGVTMLTPAREWQMDATTLTAYARTDDVALQNASDHGCRIDQNLWGRAMELLESLTLIAGRHGIGRFETSEGGRTLVYEAPAAVVLHTARAASTGDPAWWSWP